LYLYIHKTNLRGNLMNLLIKSVASTIAVAGTVFFGAGTALASDHGYNQESSCGDCNNVTLPASSTDLNVATPGAEGSVRTTTTESERLIKVIDTYHWKILVQPTGVSSEVVDVESSGVKTPCLSTCDLDDDHD
jgi:hypothetical protein